MDKMEYLLDLYDIELHKRLMYSSTNRKYELKLTLEHISALEEIIKIVEEHEQSINVYVLGHMPELYLNTGRAASPPNRQ